MLNFRHIKFFFRILVQIYKQLVDHQKRKEQVVFAIIELIDENEAKEMANHIAAQEIGDMIKALTEPATPKSRGTLN